MNNISIEKEFRALGTNIYIQIVISDVDDERKASENIERVKNIYREKERILSRFDSESELSILNSHLGQFVEVSDDIVYLARKALNYHKKSDGLFDPRVLVSLEEAGYKEDFKKNAFNEKKKKIEKNKIEGDLKEDLRIEGNRVMFKKRMDFSGIAKGYITDKVSEFLKERGWKNFLVDSGGDMFARGKNRRGKKWGISLEGSPNEDESLIMLSNKGVATSGITRKRWKISGGEVHHIINPKKTGDFNFDIKSVTVIDKNAEKADVLAKVLFLLGPKKGIEHADKNKIKSIFLLEDGRIILSKYFE